MGWGRYLLLGSLKDRAEVDEARKLLHALREQDQDRDNVPRQMEILHREVDQLKLYLAAIVQTVEQHGAITRDELARIVARIERPESPVDDLADESEIPDSEPDNDPADLFPPRRRIRRVRRH